MLLWTERVEEPIPGFSTTASAAIGEAIGAASPPSEEEEAVEVLVSGERGEEGSSSAAEAAASKNQVCSAENPTSCADVSKLGTSVFADLVSAALSSTEGGGGGSGSNVLISPLSIAQALALVSAGATSGSTCEFELLNALGATGHDGVPMLTSSILEDSENKAAAGKEETKRPSAACVSRRRRPSGSIPPSRHRTRSLPRLFIRPPPSPFPERMHPSTTGRP